MSDTPAPAVTAKVINALYIEAMVLADEARAYFDLHSRDSRNQMTPLQRVGFSCESLKVTTRLMHVVAWLLTQRALAENAPTVENRRSQQLGDVAQSETDSLLQLPSEAQQLISASIELYARVKWLEDQLVKENAPLSPARGLQSRLLEAF
jgi:regulator of CtrA degradation